QLDEAGSPLDVAVPLDGPRVARAEVLRRAQEAGADDVKEAVELAEVVLERGAGERDACVGVDALRGPRAAGPGVLDRLRLVEDEGGELDAPEHLDVAGEDVVAGHDDVAGAE